MYIKEVFPQLDTIKFNKNKPILICDADEVIFNFMDELIIFLNMKNFSFNWKSYALTGNIFNDKGYALSTLDVKLLLKNFFSSCTVDMKLMKGAKSSLKKLSLDYNIVILSNIPFEYYDLRKSALEKHKLTYPFIANKGEKGKACFAIYEMFKQKTWFIDDSPYQIDSVKKAVPNINTILYIGNQKLAKLIEIEKCWDYYTNKWNDNIKILKGF